MKKYTLLFFVALLANHWATAQLYIQNGAGINTTGHSIITLQNVNLVNDGTYSQQSGGITIFNGSRNDSMQGTAQPSFDSLHIAKTGGGKVVMQQFIYVNNVLKFTTGLLDLHGKTIWLKSEASVVGETETSHATDTVLGGSLSIQQSLNAPNAVNPGNLGAVITSAKDLGSVMVTRYHNKQVTNGGSTVATVSRQFEITPFPAANNNNLDATLRFHYLDAELNGLNESSLVFLKSTTPPYTSFTAEGFSSREVAVNYVEKTGINDFSLWALASAGAALPLKLISFSGKCEPAGTQLHWRTADEQQVSHIVVQQSSNGTQWNTIGSVPYENNVHAYSFTGKTIGNYYRLNMVDLDGHMEYSGIIDVRCGMDKDALSLYPNPAHEVATLQVITQQSSALKINIHTVNGQLLSSEIRQLQPGTHIIPINISTMLAGTYFIHAYWGNGKYSKVIKLVKL